MELPANEENDEEVVGVPKAFEMGAALFLSGKVDHDSKSGGHDPASRTGASGEVGSQECHNTTTGCWGGNQGKLIEVDHMREDMNDGADDNGPGGSFVESDILIEGDDVIQGRATEEGDEVAADGEQNKNNIDV